MDNIMMFSIKETLVIYKKNLKQSLETKISDVFYLYINIYIWRILNYKNSFIECSCLRH